MDKMEKSILEMVKHQKPYNVAWRLIDEGLRMIMERNDDLSNHDLRKKHRKLRFLGKLVEKLCKKVDKRIEEVEVGRIEIEEVESDELDELLENYRRERIEIDINFDC